MPSGWDEYRFFADLPAAPRGRLTKTAQLLVEGRYSGVLEPERHYIPVGTTYEPRGGARAGPRSRVLERMADHATRTYIAAAASVWTGSRRRWTGC